MRRCDGGDGKCTAGTKTMCFLRMQCSHDLDLSISFHLVIASSNTSRNRRGECSYSAMVKPHSGISSNRKSKDEREGLAKHLTKKSCGEECWGPSEKCGWLLYHQKSLGGWKERNSPWQVARWLNVSISDGDVTDFLILGWVYDIATGKIDDLKMGGGNKTA